MIQKLRILYATGPGDVVGTYASWRQQQDDPVQLALTYSAQFFEVCCAMGAEAYIISSHPLKQRLKSGGFLLEHRPVPLRTQTGLLYHLGQVWHGLSLITSALLYRADVVVASGTSYLFLLSVLPQLGIKVVPSLHCTLWCKNLPTRPLQNLLSQLNGKLFAKHCAAILAISEDVISQVNQIAQQRPSHVVRFLPTYRESEFHDVLPPRSTPPFCVLFAGRVERDKGVFDLLEIARRFKAEGRHEIVFHVCGDGSALQALRRQVSELQVDANFITHGQCDKQKMRQLLNLAHAVVVPTRTDFVEGLNKVVVEGVLSGRPVITSNVCPAISYVRSAVVEVEPDDVQAYGNAILQLCDDKELYEQKRRSCLDVQQPFFDPGRSWGEAVRSVLSLHACR